MGGGSSRDSEARDWEYGSSYSPREAPDYSSYPPPATASAYSHPQPPSHGEPYHPQGGRPRIDRRDSEARDWEYGSSYSPREAPDYSSYPPPATASAYSHPQPPSHGEPYHPQGGRPRIDRSYLPPSLFYQIKVSAQVTEALSRAGLESSNLIVGIDFTKSNEWTGKVSFGRRSLHHIGDTPNPYEQAISILGRTLSRFDEDNLIPCFGFGDGKIFIP
ncbi:hypothetical protein ZIOFF_017412 [Zingiber officinale]|uniref:Copine C-terminal domain-containing protein n=1 Tax=Zingiber officinale TaxID=94328 RepID=A0A8J5LIV3_ZINOF|nr:hypothetical protein ZIOFF_017412 [Zingiber officinale]